MYHPYQNFVDSFYFYQFLCTQSYFNYEPIPNFTNVSSNLILVDKENRLNDKLYQEQKPQQAGQSLKPSSKCVKSQHPNLVRISLKKQKKQLPNSIKKQKKVKKTTKRNDIVQKQGRNSHSNILRKFFKLLFVETQVQLIVEKIICKYNIQIEATDFFEQIKVKNIDYRNYIRVKEVDWLFESSLNPVNKIARILFQDYLKNHYIEHLLSSKKTNNKSVGFHLEGRRSICHEIINESLKD